MVYKYIKLCHPKSLDTVLDTLFDTVFLRGYIKLYEILTILILRNKHQKKPQALILCGSYGFLLTCNRRH